MSLDDMGLKHGTDKASSNHNYLDRYEALFNYDRDLFLERGRKINLLEIGVSDARSLFTWKEYFFDCANIYGIDINEKCKQYEKEGIRIFIGDQGDDSFLESVCNQIPDGLDFIIDDGSHYNHHILSSFEFLWPKLNDLGIYVIEDLHSAYLNNKFNPLNSENPMDFLFARIKDMEFNGKCINEDISGSPENQCRAHLLERSANYL